MRHRLTHGSLDINLDIVWDTAATAIPHLREQLAGIIESLGPDS